MTKRIIKDNIKLFDVKNSALVNNIFNTRYIITISKIGISRYNNLNLSTFFIFISIGTPANCTSRETKSVAGEK